MWRRAVNTVKLSLCLFAWMKTSERHRKLNSTRLSEFTRVHAERILSATRRKSIPRRHLSHDRAVTSKFSRRRQVSPPREAERHSSRSVRHITVSFPMRRTKRSRRAGHISKRRHCQPESFPGSWRGSRVSDRGSAVASRPRLSFLDEFRDGRAGEVADKACPGILWKFRILCPDMKHGEWPFCLHVGSQGSFEYKPFATKCQGTARSFLRKWFFSSEIDFSSCTRSTSRRRQFVVLLRRRRIDFVTWPVTSPRRILFSVRRDRWRNIGRLLFSSGFEICSSDLSRRLHASVARLFRSQRSTPCVVPPVCVCVSRAQQDRTLTRRKLVLPHTFHTVLLWPDVERTSLELSRDELHTSRILSRAVSNVTRVTYRITWQITCQIRSEFDESYIILHTSSRTISAGLRLERRWTFAWTATSVSYLLIPISSGVLLLRQREKLNVFIYRMSDENIWNSRVN